nr:hypothetical protein 17 [Legionellales bacterium]
MAQDKGIFALQYSAVSTDTSSTTIGYLPANAYITDIKVLVTTAFDAGVVIDIGDSSTANLFSNDVDPTSTGAATVTLTAQAGVVQSTTDQTAVTFIVVAGGSTLQAGAAKIVVEYAFNE